MIAKCEDSCSTKPNDAAEYLVKFGLAGHLGRFAACGLARKNGDRVVIQTTRGTELGQVLGKSRHAIADPHIGKLLRHANQDDEQQSAQRERQSRHLCASAEKIAANFHLSLAILDAEIMLDGRGAVLHVLSGNTIDAGPLLDELAEQHGMIVRLYDFATELPPPADAADALEEFKCDKPDCGEGDCSSCGTDGGCSTCSAGGANELASYFAELREKMETHNRVPLA